LQYFGLSVIQASLLLEIEISQREIAEISNKGVKEEKNGRSTLPSSMSAPSGKPGGQKRNNSLKSDDLMGTSEGKGLLGSASEKLIQKKQPSNSSKGNKVSHLLS
jgi:hypothetical protein